MFALLISAALLIGPDAKGLDQTKVERPGIERAVAMTPAPAPALEGVAVSVECSAAGGQISDCRVLNETHPGLGFGDAAVALMQSTATAPADQTGRFSRTIQFTP